jgi:hypothetical protein
VESTEWLAQEELMWVMMMKGPAQVEAIADDVLPAQVEAVAIDTLSGTEGIYANVVEHR